jgi:chemotaxis protein methyltransferase CheR
MTTRLMGGLIETRIDSLTFRRIAEIVYQKAGIVLDTRKEALVSARISKRMHRLGITRFRDYLRFLEESPESGEPVEMLNAISTNVTHFFREPRHFDQLARWLDQWRAGGHARFRFWCAGCSSGEEPYSMAMTVREHLPGTCDVRILATDLSTHALKTAREGIYTPEHMSKVSGELTSRYFSRHHTAAGFHYRVSPALARMITFARLNLAQTPYPMSGPFDVIFCRNVMIYFDNQVRARLLGECWRLLRPQGYLVVGHAESLSGHLSQFKSMAASIYTKP